MEFLTDAAGRDLRLTDERLEHIERRPEMEAQLSKIEETLANEDADTESELTRWRGTNFDPTRAPTS